MRQNRARSRRNLARQLKLEDPAGNGKLSEMLSILEVPTVRRQAASISVETYHRLGEQGLVAEQTELLRGVIIEKMNKSPLYVSLVRHLMLLAEAAAGEEYVVRKEDPLTLADSEPEPDLAIVRGDASDFRRRHPTTAVLVIEVAVSSEEIDREKVAIYAAANIPECWLVLPARSVVEVFTQPEDGVYRHRLVYSEIGALVSEQLPALRVDLERLFA